MYCNLGHASTREASSGRPEHSPIRLEQIGESDTLCVIWLKKALL